MKYFYDTIGLINYWYNNTNELPSEFVISIYTIQYLEEHQQNIEDMKRILKQLSSKEIKWELAPLPPFPLDCEEKLLKIYPFKNKNYYELASAINYERKFAPDETIFITGTLSQSIIANLFFGEDSIQFIEK